MVLLGRTIGLVADCADLAARILCACLFFVMIAVVGYEVVMRYLFNAPTFWSAELAKWSMVWMVFLGFSLSFRRLDHIRVDFHLANVSGRPAVILAALRYAVTLTLTLVLLVHGFKMAANGLRQLSPGLGINYAWLYASTVVSAALILIFLTEMILRRETRPF